jgi:hypothetical protein
MNVKLIDILVKELPNRGGWPNGCAEITQDADGCLCIWKLHGARCDSGYWSHHSGFGLHQYWSGIHAMPGSEDGRESIITKDKYEEALAASKPEWDGEGVPPVGADVQCICNQFPSEGQEKLLGKILYSGEYTILHTYKTNELHHVPVESVLMTKHWSITPIRSEANKKRDEIIEALKDGLGHAHGLYDLIQIYHLLNNGKIPHIRID